MYLYVSSDTWGKYLVDNAATQQQVRTGHYFHSTRKNATEWYLYTEIAVVLSVSHGLQVECDPRMRFSAGSVSPMT